MGAGPTDRVGWAPTDQAHDDEFANLRRAHAAGALARDVLWQRLQVGGRTLLKYPPLLAEGTARSIEITASGLHIVLRSGLRFEWNPTDLRSPPNMIVVHGQYEPHELRLLEALAADSSTILDIGANMGWYAVHLAKAARKAGARLHAFEPIPASFAALGRNIDLNSLAEQVSCHATGLGEREDRVTFYVPTTDGTPAASRVPLFENQPNVEIVCSIQRLDEWTRSGAVNGIGLIKMDIEGSEIFALRGGLKTLQRDLPVIFCEMLRKWSAKFGYRPDDILALLSPLGYECWAVTDAGLELTSSVTDDAVATNFLFMHRAKHAGRAERLRSTWAG